MPLPPPPLPAEITGATGATGTPPAGPQDGGPEPEIELDDDDADDSGVGDEVDSAENDVVKAEVASSSMATGCDDVIVVLLKPVTEEGAVADELGT